MSADNYIGIKKIKNKYYGYMYDASSDKRMGKELFIANTLENAVRYVEIYCNDNVVEYGYRFINYENI